MALEMVIGTAIQQLLRVIQQERRANFRFESILNDLKSTLESAFPKVNEICELRESNGLPNDELHRLLEQLNQAKETIDKCSEVACWNSCKKRKYIKQLLRLDVCLRNMFLIYLQMDQYKNTTLIQVQLDDLAKRLGPIKGNGSYRFFNHGRRKVSDAAGELKKIVRSLPGWIFLYLVLLVRIPRWGYQRITQLLCEFEGKR
ncbi:hypothetical protein PTKIN_Ptkin08bG0169900 [Pterospermum kingtungense]